MPETNKLTISNCITLNKRNLDPGNVADIRLRLSYDNPKFVKNRRLGFSNYTTPPIIAFYQENAAKITFPRGLIKDLFQIVPNISIEDHTVTNPVKFTPSKISLIPYQKKAVAAMMEKNQGVLDAVVASGKTVMMCELMSRLRQKTLILCHTRDLKLQWRDRIKTFLGMKAGLIDDKNFDCGGPVTVAMVQSLTSKKLTEDFTNIWGLVVLDECHHCPASTFERLVNQFPAKHRYGCTGTVERRDGLSFVLHAVMGPVVHTITREDVLSAGQIIQPKIKAVMTACYLPECGDYRTLIDAVIGDADRNQLIMKYIINESGTGRSCLVLSERISHLDDLHLIFSTLRPDIRSETITGKTPKGKKRAILKDVEEGKVKVLFASRIAEEGLDLPILSRLFLTCPIRSSGKVIQMCGRVMRKFRGKHDAVVFDFIDRNIGLAWSQWLSRKREAYSDFEIEELSYDITS